MNSNPLVFQSSSQFTALLKSIRFHQHLTYCQLICLTCYKNRANVHNYIFYLYVFFQWPTVRVESNSRSDIHVTVWMLVRNIWFWFGRYLTRVLPFFRVLYVNITRPY